ncbi:MAG: hypothetical protein M3340_00590 [Actinomycetota bacterium]|nr:hypothetical protein [Actinomycetota bacterium]
MIGRVRDDSLERVIQLGTKPSMNGAQPYARRWQALVVLAMSLLVVSLALLPGYVAARTSAIQVRRIRRSRPRRIRGWRRLLAWRSRG